MPRPELDWKEIPWPLWVYAAVILLGLVFIEIMVKGPVLAMALLAVVNLTWAYFLLRGVRWLWILTLSACVLGLVLEAVSGSPHWRGVTTNGLGLILLSLPATRRFFAASRAAPVA